ncbi:hypothetical protein B0H14DRAFT_2606635 [Mycena olivaceomarginata]|nr:hypothetical protein B0H14DRAFT_2606635 [Mycena olivaceomarginata]
MPNRPTSMTFVLVDNTIDSFSYIDVLPAADAIIASLTEKSIKAPSTAFHNEYFSGDAEKLLANSADYVARSTILNRNTAALAARLHVHAFGPNSPITKVLYPSLSDTAANYAVFLRPNCNPSYWTCGVNRWLSIRMTSLSSIITALMAVLAIRNKDISVSLAGFALAFSNTIIFDLLLLVREFVGFEQAMVGLEHFKEYSDLSQESAEFIKPRLEPSWPEHGAIRCENLVIRYTPDLPDVLHNMTFDVKPGEKVLFTVHFSQIPERFQIGILSRTGSVKSTLALSFFSFVEVTEGQIVVDGLDILKIGLTDLRSRLTIIPRS